MGQKVNPVGLRIGVNKGWQARWFATRDYARLLKEDMLIRQIIEDQLGNAGISRIEMERTSEEVKVDMFTAKPGMVIGRRGATINDIRKTIEDATGNIIQLNIVEVKKPELVANLVAESIANQLLGRVSFRRAMKKAISLSLKAGAKGIKIQCSGRLGGAEMARTEWYREGRVPLHTLRANIDYGFAEANTTFGKIGVKVWIYLGDFILDETEDEKKRSSERQAARPERSEKRPGDGFRSRVKKGAKKIKEIRKTVISSGLKSEDGSADAEAKTEKAPGAVEEKTQRSPEAVEARAGKVPGSGRQEEKKAAPAGKSQEKVSAGPKKEKPGKEAGPEKKKEVKTGEKKGEKAQESRGSSEKKPGTRAAAVKTGKKQVAEKEKKAEKEAEKKQEKKTGSKKADEKKKTQKKDPGTKEGKKESK